MKGEIAMIKNIEGYELNIHTDYPAKSVSYSSTPRSLSNIKYIVIHYTGNKGDKASSNARYYAQSNTRTAGAHFFIDKIIIFPVFIGQLKIIDTRYKGILCFSIPSIMLF